MSAASNNLASTVERVKNADILTQLADKTKSSASALGSKLEGAITDADGVMKSVEGALVGMVPGGFGVLGPNRG